MKMQTLAYFCASVLLLIVFVNPRLSEHAATLFMVSLN